MGSSSSGLSYTCILLSAYKGIYSNASHEQFLIPIAFHEYIMRSENKHTAVGVHSHEKSRKKVNHFPSHFNCRFLQSTQVLMPQWPFVRAQNKIAIEKSFKPDFLHHLHQSLNFPFQPLSLRSSMLLFSACPSTWGEADSSCSYCYEAFFFRMSLT